MAGPEQTRQPDRLVVVFAPGLWPFRSELDGVSWLLAEGVARTFSQIHGHVGYATPEARVDPRGPRDAPRVMRSLPADELVARECDALGAALAVTGRILEDRTQVEAWLNLIDGPTGALLWTGRAAGPRALFPWRFTGLLRQMLRKPVREEAEWLSVRHACLTGSFEALLAYARARGRAAGWDGEVGGGISIVQGLARALVLDPQLAEAASLLEVVGLPLVAKVTDRAQAEALREGPVESSEHEVVRALRRALHERLLTLAEASGQT